MQAILLGADFYECKHRKTFYHRRNRQNFAGQRPICNSLYRIRKAQSFQDRGLENQAVGPQCLSGNDQQCKKTKKLNIYAYIYKHNTNSEKSCFR